MSDPLKKTERHTRLEEAMQTLHDLSIPEILQEVALKHLLDINKQEATIESIPTPKNTKPVIPKSSSTADLRSFIEEKKLKSAAKIIPCLYHWAKQNEEKAMLNEKEILELYRRANIRPPKNISQSMRDLSSKTGRLESVKGEKGYYKLSQVGEDFVLYDIG